MENISIDFVFNHMFVGIVGGNEEVDKWLTTNRPSLSEVVIICKCPYSVSADLKKAFVKVLGNN